MKKILLQRWFTLPELLVSMTILAILSTFWFLSYINYTSNTRDTARSADLKNITTILSLNKTRSSIYPSPTTGVNVTYSGATVWTQGVFGIDTMRETGKIFGELRDPKYKNQYTYSVTSNKKEYQLGAVFENISLGSSLFSYSQENPFSLTKAYAAGPFDPLELSPTIWLDANDLNGDGNTTNNPANNTTVTSWVNKSAAGTANNPVITTGTLTYATAGFNSVQKSVFIPQNAGLRLANSNIMQGDIFYVVQKRDPFAATDSNGIGLQSTTTANYIIGYSTTYRDAIRINSAPNRLSSAPATTSNGTDPYIYSFHTDGTNYSFFNTANSISQGATNSVAWQVWWFNAAGAINNQGADLVVSEILIFNQSLSAGNKQSVEGYLAHKWGVTSLLPAAHPYKTTPPESSGPIVPPDTTPDAFVFSDVTSALTATLYTSNTITISGINTASPVNITGSGAEYSINGGAFTSASGTISVWNTIQVRLTSSSANSTTTTATLNIGWVSEWYILTTLVADTTPDALVFSSVNDASLNTSYTSNSVTITWLNVVVPINITGTWALYRVSDGIPTDMSGLGTATSSSNLDASNAPLWAFDNNTTTTGWANNNVLPAWLQYDFGIGVAEQITKYTLYRNASQAGGWSNNNYSPKNWTFEGSDNGSTWTILDTETNQVITTWATKQEYSFVNPNYYRYYRINISAVNHASQKWVNITEMELLSDGGGTFVSTSGTVQNNSIVSIRMPAANTPSTSRTATLTVGAGSGSYTLTTVPPDTTPDTFAFTSVSNATLGASYTSSSITISGINTSSAISLSGVWQYRINAGAYTSSAGTVQNGDVITIQQSASASNSTTTSSTLIIGWVSAVYNVTTPAPPLDTTPDAFSFTDVTGASTGTVFTSNTITISGTNTGSTLSISWWTYNIGGSGSYVGTPTTVQNGNIISVRTTSSSNFSTAVNVVLTINWVSDTYTVTTLAADTTPDPFILSAVTNAELNKEYITSPVVISGINVAIPITISWPGGGKYSINGGPWTNGAGMVNNGDEVRIKLQSLASWNSNIYADIIINGLTSGRFDISTLNPDTTPDAFVFQDITNATLNTQYISDTITISGINSPAPISITWGEYRIGALGTFTSSGGTISNGQTLSLRVLSALAGSLTRSVTVTIGWVSDTYNVQTQSYSASSQETSSLPESNVYVTGNYNGLFVYGKTADTHYIVATPSIMAYDLSNPDILSLISQKKLVYNGFLNLPSSYKDSKLTMSGGFDFSITAPLLYEGNRKDLGAYGWLKQIDEWVKSIYNNFPAYANIASYMDDYSLGYLENIIGNIIGINPIKPFYCSDILSSKLVYNIASEARITASPSANNTYGTGGIANGLTSTVWDLDYEYHSAAGNASIFFEWPTSKKIGYIKIYNRTWCCSERLSGANIKLYNTVGEIIYSHALWNTAGDYVIDLDLEGIGQLHDVKMMSIETVGWNLLNIREVEIYLWGNVKDGVYKVDKDGLWGQSPYNVYCDMTTDGGGWTRIGENYIQNGNFEGQNHVNQYTFQTFDSPSDNLLVANVTQAPPSSLTSAFVLQKNGSSSESYQLFFPDIPGEYFAQEIRLSAWVKGTNSSIFQNIVDYGSSMSSTQPDYNVLETLEGWQYQMVRIPLTGLVSDFTWDIGKNISGPFYVTGLKMEVYYR